MFDISDFPLDAAASGNHSCMSSNKIDFGEQTSHHGTRIWKLECKNNQDKGTIEGGHCPLDREGLQSRYIKVSG